MAGATTVVEVTLVVETFRCRGEAMLAARRGEAVGGRVRYAAGLCANARAWQWQE